MPSKHAAGGCGCCEECNGLPCWNNCPAPTLTIDLGNTACCPLITIEQADFFDLGNPCITFWSDPLSPCTVGSGLKYFSGQQDMNLGGGGAGWVYQFTLNEDIGPGIAQKVSVYRVTKGSVGGCFNGVVSISLFSQTTSGSQTDICTHPTSITADFCTI